MRAAKDEVSQTPEYQASAPELHPLHAVGMRAHYDIRAVLDLSLIHI